MTRQEFEEISSYGELFDLSYDINCEDIMDCIYSDDSYNELVSDEISEWVRNTSWQEIRDRLNDYPSDSYFYYRDDYGEFYATESGDDVFCGIKDEFRDYMEDNDLFDEDEDEEEGEDEYVETDEGEYTYAGNPRAHLGARINPDVEKTDTSLVDNSDIFLEFFQWGKQGMRGESFIVDEA